MLWYKLMFDLVVEDVIDDCIVVVYSMVMFKDGEKFYEVMCCFEIDKVCQVSQIGVVGKVVQFGNDKGKEIKFKGLWVDWFLEQVKKIVICCYIKMLLMSGDLVDVEVMDDWLVVELIILLFGSVKVDVLELIDIVLL